MGVPSKPNRSPSGERTLTIYSSDPLAQILHQAYGSHAIVDADFDHFGDEDSFLHHDKLAPVWEMSNAW